MEIEDIHIPTIGREYETLMRRLFPKVKSKRFGCDKDLMIYLIDSEMAKFGNLGYKKPYRTPSHSKQVDKIKNNINIALNRLIDKPSNTEQLLALLDIQERIDYYSSFRSIMFVLRELDDIISSSDKKPSS